MSRVVLAVLAHIEQSQRRAAVEQVLEGGRTDLTHDG